MLLTWRKHAHAGVNREVMTDDGVVMTERPKECRLFGPLSS